jgi:hypothetical protein
MMPSAKVLILQELSSHYKMVPDIGLISQVVRFFDHVAAP